MIDRRPLVLHIVEALGGGIMVALRDYIASTEAEVQHIILANHRKGHDTGDLRGYSTIALGRVSSGIMPFIRIRRAVRELRPDIVHLHSSWAGFLGRLCVPNECPIIYTPHCYAFERQDIGPVPRFAFRLVEKMLSPRTDVVIAVSPRENELSRALRRSAWAVYVPNIARVDTEEESCRTALAFTIVGAGRVTSQKGPDWFAEVARLVLKKHAQVRFVWLGGGDAAMESVLIESGVEVTGWLTRKQVLTRMKSADLYIHSASWEGAPLTAIEAAALGLPVIGRDIPALRSLGFPVLHPTAKDAACWLFNALRQDAFHRLSGQMQPIAARHTIEFQREGLLHSYRLASPSAFS